MGEKLTIKQASQLTGYSEGHLRRLCIEGAFGDNGAMKFANAWAIDKDALLLYVKEAEGEGGSYGPR